MRLAVGSVIIAYLVLIDHFPAGWNLTGLLLVVFYLASTLQLVTAYCRVWPPIVHHVLGQLIDMVCVSYTHYLAGAVTSPIILVYIWIIIGNSFRFGRKPMLTATALGAVGYLLASIASGYHLNEPVWMVFNLIAITALGLYCGHLMAQLYESQTRCRRGGCAPKRDF